MDNRLEPRIGNDKSIKIFQPKSFQLRNPRHCIKVDFVECIDDLQTIADAALALKCFKVLKAVAPESHKTPYLTFTKNPIFHFQENF